MSTNDTPAPEHVPIQSPDMRTELLNRLRAAVPEAFADGKLSLEALSALVGDAVETGPERYGLTWPGKAEAIAMLQAPSSATLVPDVAESVGWNDARHVFIEGENLEVLKLLYRAYFGKVKLIYIDPPYNTGNDFIYPDNFADPLRAYLRMTGQVDDEGDATTSAPEVNGRKHSSWLSTMYPRLALARQLLADDGIIFVSIDEGELFNLRAVLNELFGEENFVSEIIWKKAYGGGAKAKGVVSHHEYVVTFAKSRLGIERIDLPPDPETRKYYKSRDDKVASRGPYRLQPLWTNSMDERVNLRYPLTYESQEVWPDKQWQWEPKRAMAALQNNELEFVKKNGGYSVYYKQYLYDDDGEERAAKLFSVIDGPYTQSGTSEVEAIFGDGKVFPFPKPSQLIRKLLSVAWRNERVLVLDFFGGSASTAVAVSVLNGEGLGVAYDYILVQIPEALEQSSAAGKLGYKTVADIGRARAKRVAAGEGGTIEGFRAFRLASSNLRRWAGTEAATGEAYLAALEGFADPLAPGFDAQAVIWEVALREGYPLTSRIEALPGEAGFHRVTDTDGGKAFTITLALTLTLADARALDLAKADLLVVRAAALDDTLAANLALQCTLKLL